MNQPNKEAQASAEAGEGQGLHGVAESSKGKEAEAVLFFAPPFDRQTTPRELLRS